MLDSLYFINGTTGLSGLSSWFDMAGSYNKVLSDQAFSIQQGLFSMPTIMNTSLEPIWSRMVLFAIIFLVVQIALYVWKVIMGFHTKEESLPIFFTKLLIVLGLIYGFAIFNDFLASVLIGSPKGVEVENKVGSQYVVRTIYPGTAIQVLPRTVKSTTFQEDLKVKLNDGKETNVIPEGTVFPKDLMSMDGVQYKAPVFYDDDHFIRKTGCSVSIDADGKPTVTPPEKQSIDVCLINKEDVKTIDEIYTQDATMNNSENTVTVGFPLKVIQTLLQNYSKNERYSYAMVGTNYGTIFNDKCTVNPPPELFKYVRALKPFSTDQNILEYNKTNLKDLQTKWQEVSKDAAYEPNCYSNDIQLLLLLSANNIVNSLNGEITETINNKETDTSLDKACFEEDDNGTKKLKPDCLDQKNACLKVLSPTENTNMNDLKKCFVNDITNTTNVLTKETTDFWKFAVGMENVNNFDFKNIQGIAIPTPQGMDWGAAVDPRTKKVTGENAKNNNWLSWVGTGIGAIIGGAVIFVGLTAFAPISFVAIVVITAICSAGGAVRGYQLAEILTDWSNSSKKLLGFEYKKMNREPFLASVYSYDLDGSKDTGAGNYENKLNTLGDYDTYTFSTDEYQVGNLSLYDIQSPCGLRLRGVSGTEKIQDVKTKYNLNNLIDSASGTLNDYCPSLNGVEIKAPTSDGDLKIFKRKLFSYEVSYSANPRFNPTFSYGKSDGWADKFSEAGRPINLSYQSSNYRCVKTLENSGDKMVQASDRYCSFGDYARITDVRLQPYNTSADAKDVSYLGDSKLETKRNFYNSIIAHVSIPIVHFKDGAHEYTADRYNQIYAKEAVPVMPGVATPKGLKVQEGDVFAVKPGSVVGTDSTAFKIIYDKRIEPWIQTVDLFTGDAIPDRNDQSLYGNGLFSKFYNFLGDIGIGATTFKGINNSAGVLDVEKSSNAYAKDVYASRPDQVKESEGNIVAWVLDPFVGLGYTNMSGASSFATVGGLFAGPTRILLAIISIILFVIWLIANVRLLGMKLILIISPFLFVFLIGNPFLSENQSKRIFLKTLQVYIAMIVFSFMLLFGFLLSRWILGGFINEMTKGLFYFAYLGLALFISCLPAIWITWLILTKNVMIGGLELAYDMATDKVHSIGGLEGINSTYGEQMKGLKNKMGDALGESITSSLSPIKKSVIEQGKKLLVNATDSAKTQALPNFMKKKENHPDLTKEDLQNLSSEELVDILYNKGKKNEGAITNIAKKMVKGDLDIDDKQQLLELLTDDMIKGDTMEEKINSLLELRDQESYGVIEKEFMEDGIKQTAYFKEDEEGNLVHLSESEIKKYNKSKSMKSKAKAFSSLYKGESVFKELEAAHELNVGKTFKNLITEDVFSEREAQLKVKEYEQAVTNIETERAEIEEENQKNRMNVEEENQKNRIDVERENLKLKQDYEKQQSLFEQEKRKYEQIVKSIGVDETSMLNILRDYTAEGKIYKDEDIPMLKSILSVRMNSPKNGALIGNILAESLDLKTKTLNLSRSKSGEAKVAIQDLIALTQLRKPSEPTYSEFKEKEFKEKEFKAQIGPFENKDLINLVSKKYLDKDALPSLNIAESNFNKFLETFSSKDQVEVEFIKDIYGKMKKGTLKDSVEASKLKKYFALAQSNEENKENFILGEKQLDQFLLRTPLTQEMMLTNRFFKSVDLVRNNSQDRDFTFGIDKRIVDSVSAYATMDAKKQEVVKQLNHVENSAKNNPLARELITAIRENGEIQMAKFEQLKTQDPKMFASLLQLQKESQDIKMTQNHIGANVRMRDSELYQMFVKEINQLKQTPSYMKENMVDWGKKAELDYYKEGGDLMYYMAYPDRYQELAAKNPQAAIIMRGKLDKFYQDKAMKDYDRREWMAQFSGFSQQMSGQSLKIMDKMLTTRLTDVNSGIQTLKMNQGVLNNELQNKLRLGNTPFVFQDRKQQGKEIIYVVKDTKTNNNLEFNEKRILALLGQEFIQNQNKVGNLSKAWFVKTNEANIERQIKLNEQKSNNSKASNYLNKDD